MNMRFIGVLSAMLACLSVIATLSHGANNAAGGNLDLMNSTSLNITLQAMNETNNSSNITATTKNGSIDIEVEGNRTAFKLGNLSRPPAKNASDLWYLIQGANHNKVP